MRPIDRIARAAAATLLLHGAVPAQAQRWDPVPAPTTTSLRGVSAPAPGVVWVSGARGAVARTVDGGATWTMLQVPGADSLDFRDIAAFDASTAFVLSIGNGAQSRIYRTVDGGRSWALQFTNPDSAAFYDCFAFWDAQRGVVMGDPVQGRFTILRTADGGATWHLLAPAAAPAALDGEAGFAASGTCVAAAAPERAWIATGGGARARVLRSDDAGASWLAADVPSLAAGGAPRGAFSVAALDDRRLVVTGGDYEQPEDGSAVVALSDDGGATWRAPRGRTPGGYRSAVAVVPGTGGMALVAVGTSGSDFSLDGGEAWLPGDTLALNAVAFVSPEEGWAVGPRGRVVRWRGAALVPGLGRRAKEPPR